MKTSVVLGGRLAALTVLAQGLEKVRGLVTAMVMEWEELSVRAQEWVLELE